MHVQLLLLFWGDEASQNPVNPEAMQDTAVSWLCLCVCAGTAAAVIC